MPPTTAKRPYNSSRRALQAAQTREEVLRAAIALFNEHGWAGTTLAMIAEEAGVSVETIYKGFGSKKALLRQAIDVAVAGDTEALAFVERPEFAILGEGSVAERTAHGIDFVISSNERVAGVWQSIVEAASSDEEVEGWRRELDQARRTDIHRSIERILDRSVDEGTVTMLWVLYSPEVYRMLVVDGDMSTEEYATFLTDASNRVAGL